MINVPNLEELTSLMKNRARMRTRDEVLNYLVDLLSLEAKKAIVFAEIGVWEGQLTNKIISNPGVEKYYMVDPWRNLNEWNKPFNVSDDKFVHVYNKALGNSEKYADKRVVLRGTSTEVSDSVLDSELDLCYVDGDHTLRGITLDLLVWMPKVRFGGIIAGDDAKLNPWQHPKYEPTLVYPFCRYFAEAYNIPIYMTGNSQYIMFNRPDLGYNFVDLMGTYKTSALLDFMSPK
jgi:hypothetical protein